MSSNRIPYLAVARFSGDDAGAFLHSQLSADILALEPGRTTLACYCTPKGQVLGLLLAGRSGDDYLLAGKSELLPGILKRLQMYVMRSKVKIEDEQQAAVVGEAGPGYAFLEGATEIPDAEAWRAGELLAGISWLNAGSSEKFIPQMLGFDGIGAVNFNKGCYPGQEIVARARYLGKVKRGPLILETGGNPTAVPGEKLKVLRNGAWSGAVVVDLAQTTAGGVVLFTVAAQDEAPAEEIEYGGERYRCATR